MLLVKYFKCTKYHTMRFTLKVIHNGSVIREYSDIEECTFKSLLKDYDSHKYIEYVRVLNRSYLRHNQFIV